MPHLIQKRLLTDADLTFKKVCKIALAMEMADKNARELKAEACKSQQERVRKRL